VVDNKQQNRQFLEAVRHIQRGLGRKLSFAERRRLHDEITKGAYALREIIEIGLTMFRKAK
jgi:hypothetical protein